MLGTWSFGTAEVSSTEQSYGVESPDEPWANSLGRILHSAPDVAAAGARRALRRRPSSRRPRRFPRPSRLSRLCTRWGLADTGNGRLWAHLRGERGHGGIRTRSGPAYPTHSRSVWRLGAEVAHPTGSGSVAVPLRTCSMCAPHPAHEGLLHLEPARDKVHRRRHTNREREGDQLVAPGGHEAGGLGRSAHSRFADT